MLKLGTYLSSLLALSYWTLLFSYIFKETESRDEKLSFTLLNIRQELSAYSWTDVNWLFFSQELNLSKYQISKSKGKRQNKQKCYDRHRKLLSRLVARPPETKQEQLEASKNHYCLSRVTVMYCRNGEWMVLKESVRYTRITGQISDSSWKWRKSGKRDFFFPMVQV